MKKGSSFFTKVAGVSHENPDGTSRQEIIHKYVRKGQVLELRREPDNEFDKNAVAVWVTAQVKMPKKLFRPQEYEAVQCQIGYLGEHVARDASGYLARGNPIRVTVKQVSGGGAETYGVNIKVEPK